MSAPKGLKFTTNHQWVKVKANGKITVGVTDYAQGQMHAITYVELPEPDPNHEFAPEEEVGVLESNKTAAPYLAPVSGIVTAVNTNLLDNPDQVNNDPYGAGWIFEMKPTDMAEVEDLMDLDAYEATLPIEEEEEL